MSIKDRIPKELYKLFASKYMDYYQLVLIALYEESSMSYSLLGLTQEECKSIINEKISTFTIEWSREQIEDEGELLTRSNMASIMLRRLEDWGWLLKDYDEILNEYVLSFPDYSQMFVDLFGRLHKEGTSLERESMLTIYSHLFTYSSSKEKDNHILESALQASKSLLQMLSNMQEGIRGYFDQLSKQKTFLGIQEVLVQEINNTDSKKYAILTTTDSFYRYKEDVKELIDQNLEDSEEKRQEFLGKRVELEKESIKWHRNERVITRCDDAIELLIKINREFDGIERRYNRLIDQKRIFATRAAARIRYIIGEGSREEDRTKAIIQLLSNTSRKDEILDDMGSRFRLTKSFQVMKEKSFSKPRTAVNQEFEPQVMRMVEKSEESLEDFVVKPLYTKAEIQKFKKENEQDGVFKVSDDTVDSVEDLEKLLFVWQEATQVADTELEIKIENEFTTETGFHYSGFSIGRK